MNKGRKSIFVILGRLFQSIPPLFFIWIEVILKKCYIKKYPLIIIISPPRSGSTLTYQILSRGSKSLYLTNLWNLLYSTPIIGGLLSKRDQTKRHNFTSDRGLAGSFNSNIIKKVEEEVVKKGKENVLLICIGKKCYEYFTNRNYKVDYSYAKTWDNLNYNQAIEIGRNLVKSYLNKEFDTLDIIYNFFKSAATQEVVYNQFLPIHIDDNTESSIKDIIYEPSKIDIIKTLVPKFFNTQIWQCLLESFASEQAARMLAMDNATENAKDMISDLKLQFNKARQTAITTEMLEIVGGAEALSN